MREVTEFLKAHDAYFLLGLLALSLVLLICTVYLFTRLAEMNRRRNAKLADRRAEDIVDCLTDQLDALTELKNKLAELDARESEHGARLSGCLRKVGIVRFNAFDDVGGEQSFALAILDSNKTGVVLSSLHGRQDARLYAKPIVDGQGDRPLSDEERGALDQALAS